MPPTNELETERRQRRSSERHNVILMVLVMVLIGLAAAGSIWLGRVTSQRDSASDEAARNGQVATDLAARVAQACRGSDAQAVTLWRAGLCGAAASASAQVTAAPSAAVGLPGPAGPPGEPGASAPGGRS